MKTNFSYLVIFAILSSCGSADYATKIEEIKEAPEVAPASEEDIPKRVESKAKFIAFNNVDELRGKISKIGIGSLGAWKSDDADGYMSVMPYYQFDGTNYLACYLESEKYGSVKILELVLDINNGNKRPSLLFFSNTISKIYKELGLKKDNKIINAAKNGREIKIEKDNRVERIELQKSRIETWKFVIETKY